jgi:hypothetical protein
VRAITKWLIFRSPAGTKRVLFAFQQIDGFGRGTRNLGFFVAHSSLLEKNASLM